MHLNSPKVTWQQKNYCDHAGNETVTQNPTEQVYKDGADSEEKVEEGCHWMPGNRIIRKYENTHFITSQT